LASTTLTKPDAAEEKHQPEHSDGVHAEDAEEEGALREIDEPKAAIELRECSNDREAIVEQDGDETANEHHKPGQDRSARLTLCAQE
jgi:hypothetical protein